MCSSRCRSGRRRDLKPMKPDPSRYCLSCGYALVVATNNQCPECGQRFHPYYPITYTNHKPKTLIRSAVKCYSYGLLASCLFMLSLHTADSLLASVNLDHVQLAGGFTLLAILVYISFVLHRASSLICVSIGFCMGYFAAVVTIVSIRQSHLTLDVPGDLIGLAIFSTVVTLAVLPVYVLRSGYRKRLRASVLSSNMDQSA